MCLECRERPARGANKHKCEECISRNRAIKAERDAIRNRIKRNLHKGDAVAIWDATGQQIPVKAPGTCRECGKRMHRYHYGDRCHACEEIGRLRMRCSA